MAALKVNELLAHELETRKKSLSSYSMRQFALDIEVSVAQLSKVMAGKSTLSEKKLFKIARLLNWPKETFQRAMAQTANTRGRREISILKKQSQNYRLQDVDAEKFKLMSEWYHLALLELMHTKGFKTDIQWISQRLKVESDKIEKAIERLVELEFLKIHQDGRWEDISRFSSTLNSFDTSTAMKKYQSDILEKSRHALMTVDKSDRSQTGMTFTLSRSKVKEAREKIIAFQRALIASLQENVEAQEEVYQLSISLFPLTQLPVEGDQDE